ncbi:MAG TPA: hypothetical protein PKW95_17535 [bacterium]|nr:hypothetical protein [bacterium]
MKVGSSRFWLLLLLCAALLLSVGCQADDDDDDNDDHTAPADDDDDDDTTGPSTTSVILVLPADADNSLRLAVADAQALLSEAFGQQISSVTTLPQQPAGMPIVILEDTSLPAESFRLQTREYKGAAAIVIEGADERGRQYGLYHLLETMGFGFYHPEQIYIPTLTAADVPTDLNVVETPDWGRRGFHIHTMHPLEATEFLMRDNEEYLEYAKHLIDWLVRNKQNYFQFELLRTVDYDATLAHFNAIVAYAHERKVDAGLVVSWVFQQQKAWKIVPNLRGEYKEEMQANIDQLMQAPWDHLNLEMGSSEFTEVKDTIQVAWMNNTVEYLREKYPNTEASVKIHCSSGQVAEHYNNINFNYLAQEADAGLGVYPHTVMYYDLQGPAPAYGNEDFSELYEWMLSILGTRKMYYYPETAYWCSFDIDVPLFLPVYLFNRWKDIELLADKGLDGHVTFTSGHEWNYWLNDWVVARATWDSTLDWQDIIGDYANIFGDASPTIMAMVRELTLHQEDMLIGFELASYLASADTWDEIGYLVGATTHPEPMTFAKLYDQPGWIVREFEESTLAALELMADVYADFYARVEAVREQVPDNALPWYEELVDSFHVNAVRAAHVYELYAGVCARRLQETGDDPDGEEAAQEHFALAKEITEEYLGVMRRREANYRYPLFLSSGWRRSLTSYDYRYLWQASTGYWYHREERQAIEKKLSPLLDNLIDPIWFMF